MVVLTTPHKLKIAYQINYISQGVNVYRYIESINPVRLLEIEGIKSWVFNFYGDASIESRNSQQLEKTCPNNRNSWLHHNPVSTYRLGYVFYRLIA